MARRIDLHLPADVGSVQVARHAVREQIEDVVDEDMCADAELLVSELVTNGIQHGPGGASWIDVRVRMDGSGLTVEVSDDGEGFDPDQFAEPDPARAGGWGLAL
ncbi:MAG: ATP-binding protein, partial [Gaiellaceae bacterium]